MLKPQIIEQIRTRAQKVNSDRVKDACGYSTTHHYCIFYYQSFEIRVLYTLYVFLLHFAATLLLVQKKAKPEIIRG